MMEDIFKETREKHFDNLKRLAKGEELSLKDYDYLNYCLNCRRPIRIGEPSCHGFEGNIHKFGCNLFIRIISVPLNVFWLLIRLIIILPILPFFLVSDLIRKRKKRVRDDARYI